MKENITVLLLASAVPVFTHAQAYFEAPAANPPRSTATPTLASVRAVRDLIVTQCTEPNKPVWSLHMSSDGAHPNGREQSVIWLMNRARQNPTDEGAWLATSDNSQIAPWRDDEHHVNTQRLVEEFSQIASTPPAAPDCRLSEAAKAQSVQLIINDTQNHDGQFEKVATSGFVYTHARGNVFSFAKSALNAHAAFNIDWASESSEDPDDGMLDGRRHRKAVMSTDGTYTNVGLALVTEGTDGKETGPWVVTGNYANAFLHEDNPNHFNTFITGTVWVDDLADNNGRYDPGEGISDVKVVINGENVSGTGYNIAFTAAGGGYAIPVTNGIYTLSFTDKRLNVPEQDKLAYYETVVEVTENKSVLLDYKARICDEMYWEAHQIKDMTYRAGSESIICSSVSIEVTDGTTIEGHAGNIKGAVVGFISPAVIIDSAGARQFIIENGANFFTDSRRLISGAGK